MKRILSSEGATCPTCRGIGVHGSILRGGYAEKLVCKTCDGYGKLRAVKRDTGWAYIVKGEQLTVKEIAAMNLRFNPDAQLANFAKIVIT